MIDVSDMNNIGSQGITGIFVIDSQVIMKIVRLFLNYFCQSQGFILFLQQLLDGL